MLHQSGQDEARQEGFARAGRAKHARRALHEFVQVDADGMSLLAGVADDEVAFLARVAENGGDVGLGRQ